MTVRFFRTQIALLIFILAVSFGAVVSEAQYGSSTGQSGADSKQQAPPKLNKAEEDAYKVFLASRTGPPEKQIPLGEDFIKKFPDSHYLSGVYGQLTGAYYNSGDIDKMMTAGNKAVELNPDNVDVLALLAMAIPRRVQSSTPDGAQQLKKAEDYGHHAIELIPNLTKPAEMDDAAFTKAKNDKLSMAHSGLGLIDIDHSKYDDARTELTQAVQLATNPDLVDYYLLGNADAQTSYLHAAIDAYEKCAASGPLAPRCRARADSTKKDLATSLSKD